MIHPSPPSALPGVSFGLDRRRRRGVTWLCYWPGVPWEFRRRCRTRKAHNGRNGRRPLDVEDVNEHVSQLKLFTRYKWLYIPICLKGYVSIMSGYNWVITGKGPELSDVAGCKKEMWQVEFLNLYWWKLMGNGEITLPGVFAREIQRVYL